MGFSVSPLKSDRWNVSSLDQNTSGLDKVLPETVLNSPKAQELMRGLGDKISFQIKFQAGQAYLNLKGEKDTAGHLVWHPVLICDESHKQQFEKSITTAQKCQSIFQAAKEARLKEHQVLLEKKLNPTRFTKITAELPVISDGLSVVKNTATIFKDIILSPALAMKLGAWISVLGQFSAILTIFLAVRMIKSNVQKMQQAYQLKDAEMAMIAFCMSLVGVGLLLVGVSLELIKYSMFLMIGIVSGAVIYIGITVVSIYSFLKSMIFSNELSSSDDDLHSTFSRLKQQVSGEEDQVKLHKKWGQLESLITPEYCDKLIEIEPEFLNKLYNKDPETVQEAKKLLAEIQVAAARQRVKYMLLIIVGILGIAAAFSSGPIAPILFAIGGLICICIDYDPAFQKVAKTACPDKNIASVPA